MDSEVIEEIVPSLKYFLAAIMIANKKMIASVCIILCEVDDSVILGSRNDCIDVK